VSGLTQVVGIAAGGSNGLAVRADGTVWTWGSGYYLGNDTTADSYVPVQVNGLTKIVAVAGGIGGHILVLKSDGTVWAWGYNQEGELGNGTSVDSFIPVQVSGLKGGVAIAVGGSDSLAIIIQ
jgi:alpha-tubulin suppressor-like RCC1 family protein